MYEQKDRQEDARHWPAVTACQFSPLCYQLITISIFTIPV